MWREAARPPRPNRHRAIARIQHGDVRQGGGKSVSPGGEQSALDVLDRRRHGVLCERPRFINSGSLPPKDAVRVEEMINYFTYDYREPEGDKPFSIDVDATACPWDTGHRLLRIGLKGREVANEKRPASTSFSSSMFRDR